jgi:hypothetical protein
MLLQPMNGLGAVALDVSTWNHLEITKMSRSNIARAGLLLAALSLAGGATYAAVSSPFAALAGSWSGGGVLSTSDGGQERLRCRANYDVDGPGNELRLNLRCASDSYNIDLAGNVEYRGGAISGEWTEASHNASGTISGRASGGHIEAAARGDSFSADLSLTTRGGRQFVSIRPQGTSITSVSLALNRR